MNIQQELKPFHRNTAQTGLGLVLIVIGLLLAATAVGPLMAAARFNGSALVFIIATAIVACGILILDAIRCRG